MSHLTAPLRVQFMPYTQINVDSNDLGDIQLLRLLLIGIIHQPDTIDHWWLKYKVMHLQLAYFSKNNCTRNLIIGYILNQIGLANNLTFCKKYNLKDSCRKKIKRLPISDLSELKYNERVSHNLMTCKINIFILEQQWSFDKNTKWYQ